MNAVAKRRASTVTVIALFAALLVGAAYVATMDGDAIGRARYDDRVHGR
jgi:hypothetical protein